MPRRFHPKSPRPKSIFNLCGGGIRRDQADIYFSKFIRLRAKWKCEACFKSLGEGGGEASHFWGRRNESVRYDIENVSCLCNYCHRRFTENPEDHRQWMMKKLGKDRFNALMVRATTIKKKDRKLAAIIAKKLYEEECKHQSKL